MNKNTSFKINNNYPIYLLVLIPFSLVFSIFITEIILITLTVFFKKIMLVLNFYFGPILLLN